MKKTKVLISVVTYPLPSRSYDELVCTAGFLEDGSWIRIYPVPLTFMFGMKRDGKTSSYKYTWIELELSKRSDDFRPESHSPVNYDFKDIEVHNSIDTKSNWYLRKDICLKNVWTNIKELINASKAPTNISLATFKPSKIIKFDWKETDRDWKDKWTDLRKQGDLFANKNPEISIRKLPYKFYYHIEDDAGNSSKMMIEDWEIGQLYWNCFDRADGNETIALEKVKQRYDTEFLNEKDIYLFLGTTREFHRRRMNNPFVIIGVFYPKKESQLSLF